MESTCNLVDINICFSLNNVLVSDLLFKLISNRRFEIYLFTFLKYNGIMLTKS